MKKRILSMLMVILMVVGLLPTTALATEPYYTATGDGGGTTDPVTEYPLWVGGEQVTPDNLSGEGWSFTPAEGDEPATLTLDNYTYTGEGYNYINDEYAAICYEGSAALNLVLKGTNSVTQQSESASKYSSGIYSVGDIHISGGGSLTVTGSKTTYEFGDSYGVYTEGSIGISGSSLTAIGGEAPKESCGVYAEGNIAISGGTIMATGGEAYESYGVDCMGSIAISNSGSLTGTGGKAGLISAGVGANGITVSGDSILTAIGGMATGEESGSCGVVCNSTIELSDDSFLTATGGTASSSSGISNYGAITVLGGTIEASGDTATGAYGSSYGVECNGDINVSGGSLVAEGGRATGEEGSSYGVFAYSGIAVSGTGSLTATGNEAVLISAGVGAASITVSDNGSLTAKGTTGMASFGVEAYNDVTVSGGSLTGIGGTSNIAEGVSYGVACDVITVSGGETVAQGNTAAFVIEPTIADTFTDAKVWYGDSEDAAVTAGAQDKTAITENYSAKYVKIAPQRYDLYVGGVGMAEGDYLASGATETTTAPTSGGYAHYENGELTLNNYIYEDGGNAAFAIQHLGAPDSTLNIDLVGQSSVTLTNSNSMGLVALRNLTVSGSGGLSITGGSYGVNVLGDLIINGGSLSATGTNYDGVNVMGDLSVEGGSLTANGGNHGVNVMGDLTINGGSLTATGGSCGVNILPTKNVIVGANVKVYGADGQEIEEPDYSQLAYVRILVPAVASVTMNGETTSYDSFADAIDAVANCTETDNAEVKLLKDVELSDTQEITGGVFTLDLNGQSIGIPVDSDTLKVSGTDTHVTIKDSTNSNGTITGGKDCYAISVTGGATVTINGGSIVGNAVNGHGINVNGSNLNVSGGAVTATYSNVIAVSADGSNINISGGIITGDQSGVAATRSTVNVTDGTIMGGWLSGVHADTDSNINISGGTIRSDNISLHVLTSADAIITGGTITGGSHAIYVVGSATISGGSFSATNSEDIAMGSDSIVTLTLGESGVGASFPGGLFCSNPLKDILGEGAAYWQGDQMIVLADEYQTEITDGDVVVKEAAVITSVDFNSESPAYDADTKTFYIDEDHPLELTINGQRLNGQKVQIVAENSVGQRGIIDFTFTDDSSNKQRIDTEIYRKIVGLFNADNVVADIVKIGVRFEGEIDVLPDNSIMLNVVEKTYAVELPNVEGGTVVTDKENPVEGDKVTITVTPDPGMEVDKVIVKDGTGREIPVTEGSDGTYSYEQPAGDVEIEVILKKTEFESDVKQPEGGDVAVSDPTPTMGDTVTITVDPDPGKRVDDVVVKDKDGNPIEVTRNPDGTYSYEQPIGEVTIEVTFENIPVYSDPTYRPTIEESKGGVTSVSDKNPEKGDKVTITAAPDKGYEVDEIVVTDSKGNKVELIDNGDGTYTYVQPVGKVTITVTYAPSRSPGADYSDLNPDAWYIEAVDYVLRKGLMNGVDSDKFEPDGTTSRAMIWTILARLDGIDTDGKVWYEVGQKWAIEKGISDGTMANEPITREQFATILWRYAKYKDYDVSVGEDTNILSYEDAFSVSEYAIPAMQWACGAGLMQGDGVNLTPKADATRAQAAALFQRFCENVAEK